MVQIRGNKNKEEQVVRYMKAKIQKDMEDGVQAGRTLTGIKRYNSFVLQHEGETARRPITEAINRSQMQLRGQLTICRNKETEEAGMMGVAVEDHTVPHPLPRPEQSKSYLLSANFDARLNYYKSGGISVVEITVTPRPLWSPQPEYKSRASRCVRASDMPSLAISEAVEFYYEDSGIPESTHNYTTIVFIHGLGYNGGMISWSLAITMLIHRIQLYAGRCCP
jgi:hypothetical protein